MKCDLRGFGMTMDLERGTTRQWAVAASETRRAFGLPELTPNV